MSPHFLDWKIIYVIKHFTMKLTIEMPYAYIFIPSANFY